MGLFSRKSKEPQQEQQAPPAAPSEAGGVHLSVDELKLSGDTDGMLEVLVHGDDADARAEAAWALVDLKDERVVDPLVRIVQDHDEADSLRFQSIGALGKIHSTQAVQPLIDVLSDANEEVHVRAGAAVSLGWLRDTRAAEPLAEAWLKADDATLSNKAGEAFGEMGVKTSETLVSALADPQFCRRAADLLATFADKSVIPSLQKAAEEARAAKEKKAAKAAEEAIKVIEQRAA